MSDLKVNTTLVCYDMEWTDTNGDIEKVGCAHKAPGAVIPDEGGMASPNATWALIDTPSDFIPDTTFNTAGLERWENRATWYDCNSFTDEGPSRERCKQEATGIVLGNDIPTLQALAKIHKVCVHPGSWKLLLVPGSQNSPLAWFGTAYNHWAAAPEFMLPCCRQRVRRAPRTLKIHMLKKATAPTETGVRASQVLK